MSYRIITTTPTVTQRQEAQETVTVQWAQGEGAFFEKKISAPITFAKEDFAFFESLNAGGECSDVPLEIQALSSNVWLPIWKGLALPGLSKFNYSRCLAAVKTETDDSVSCFRKKLAEKKNWLVTSAKTLKTLAGTIETTTCFFSNQAAFGAGITLPAYWRECWMTGGGFTLSNAPDPALAWRPISHNQQIDVPANFPNPALWSGTTIWGRERLTSTGQPNGSGWINIGGDQWVRPLSYALELAPVMVSPTRLEVEAKVIDKQFSGGRLLKNVLESVLVGTCGITKIRSCFLGKNDDGTAPNNGAYTAAARLKNVLIFQTSDITRPDDDEDATRLELKISEMLEVLESMFLTWRIEKEGADTVLRIEHISYFLANAPFDVSPYAVASEGALEIDYGAKSPITYETYSMREAENSLFRPHTIQYPLACTDGSADEIGYLNTLTDFGWIAENDTISDEGMVLVAADQIGENLFIDLTDGYLNGAFSWRRLLTDLGRYERPFSTFSIQGQAATAITILKTAKVPPFSFKMTHAEAQAFDPSGLITGFWAGPARLESASYDLKKQRMTFALSV